MKNQIITDQFLCLVKIALWDFDSSPGYSLAFVYIDAHIHTFWCVCTPTDVCVCLTGTDEADPSLTACLVQGRSILTESMFSIWSLPFHKQQHYNQ